MRGKGITTKTQLTHGGITPAYAGKSTLTVQLLFSNPDHPRLCGEKRLDNDTWKYMPGSPPPMRGKVKKIATLITMVGITPAYAGKSAEPDKSHNHL